MDAYDKLSLMISVIAVLISVGGIIFNYIMIRPRLKVKCMIPDVRDKLPVYRPKSTGEAYALGMQTMTLPTLESFFIKIKNKEMGKHVQTLKDVGFREVGKCELCNLPFSDNALPDKIKPGERRDCKFHFFDFYTLLHDIGYERTGKIYLKFFAQNQLEKCFYSKKYEINMEKWTKGDYELKRARIFPVDIHHKITGNIDR